MQVGYRLDSALAASSVFVYIVVGSSTVGNFSLNNGWNLNLNIPAASVPGDQVIQLFYSAGSTMLAGPSVQAPSATACATRVGAPVLVPAPGTYFGGLLLTPASTAAGSAIYYTLTGATSAPATIYTGAIMLAGCGLVNVTVWATKPGYVSSLVVSGTYNLTLSNSTTVACVGVTASSISDTPTTGQLTSAGRDPMCNVVATISYINYDSSAGASQSFRLLRTDAAGLDVTLVVANGERSRSATAIVNTQCIKEYYANAEPRSAFRSHYNCAHACLIISIYIYMLELKLL